MSYLEMVTPCGTKFLVSKKDLWIFKVFTHYGITGSKSKYVFVGRQIQTEYSLVTERIYLHRLVVFGKKSSSSKMQVDHINRDRLDNRRENLRICSGRQNSGNVGPRNKKFKGVCKVNRKLTKPWTAYIKLDSGTKNLGYFKTAEEAAKVYDQAATKKYGEFAWLNFPNG
jgi:HNH endonuclease